MDGLKMPIESQLTDKDSRNPETEASAHPAAIESTGAQLLPVFDRGGLLELLGGDEGLIEPILERYLDCLSGYLDLLSAALFAFDIEQVQVQAHAIKGAAINIGALQVSEAARLLEMLARGGQLCGAVGLFDNLMSSVVNFRIQAEQRKTSGDY